MEFFGGVPHNYPMRTKFLILLSVILSFSLVAAPSNAAVKAGAKCTKAGTTATAAGKKYTCVKSGTKLVWNKGVTVKAAPKPDLNPVFKPVEPTPTPTPTPVATIVAKLHDTNNFNIKVEQLHINTCGKCSMLKFRRHI